jgi:hypothetical protein
MKKIIGILSIFLGIGIPEKREINSEVLTVSLRTISEVAW